MWWLIPRQDRDYTTMLLITTVKEGNENKKHLEGWNRFEQWTNRSLKETWAEDGWINNCAGWKKHKQERSRCGISKLDKRALWLFRRTKLFKPVVCSKFLRLCNREGSSKLCCSVARQQTTSGFAAKLLYNKATCFDIFPSTLIWLKFEFKPIRLSKKLGQARWLSLFDWKISAPKAFKKLPSYKIIISVHVLWTFV